MNNNKLIILATTFFLLISFVYLAAVEKKQADLNSKNIWVLYFNDPKGQTLDFTIENHAPNNTFHWEVLVDKTKALENNVTIKNGQTQNFPISLPEIKDKKITISVTQGSEKKEIYKNF